MKKIILPLALIFNITAEANSCLKPGKKVELKQFAVQDQDGLGICYANSASILLQHAMGWEKPVSYQQLALGHANYTRSWFNGQKIANISGNPGDRYAGEAGNICKSVEAAKQYGICDGHSFKFDVHNGQDPWAMQEKLLLAYGDLLDYLGLVHQGMGSSDWEKFSKVLASRIYNKKKDCKKDPAKFMTDKMAQMLPGHLKQRIVSFEQRIERYERELISANGEEAARIRKNIQNSKGWIRDLKDLLNAISDIRTSDSNPDVKVYQLRPKAIEELKKTASIYVSQLGNHTSSNMVSTTTSGVTNLPKVEAPLATLYRAARALGANFSTSAEQYVYSDKESLELVLQVHRIQSLCKDSLDEEMLAGIDIPAMLEMRCEGIVEGADPVMNSAIKDANTIVEVLKKNQMNTFGSKMATMFDLLAPGCLRQMQQTKSSLDKIRCESVALSSVAIMSSLQDQTSVAKESSAKRLKHSQTWMTERLCAKQPVSVDVCTDFMQKPGFADTDFCAKRETQQGKSMHANHTMAVVGYEVQSNKSVRYLVQNSWGRACPFTNSVIAAGKDAECEKDASGKLTGRFWISDKVLITNTMQLATVAKP
ncbi:MAG: C1 family peptidase [Bacteriovoracia bacterium]